MNHTYRLVWSRTLSIFVAVSELARSVGKSAGCKACRDVSGDAQAPAPHSVAPLPIAALVLSLAFSPVAQAHTSSVGYTIGANNSVEIWYGTYHLPSEATYTEGSLSFSGPNGFNRIATFVDLVRAKPIGLDDGVSNFYSNSAGTALTGVFAQSKYASQPVATWQGVIFTNLAAGNYVFTYIPIPRATAVWQPPNDVIRSNGFTITAQQLAAPPGQVNNPIDTTVSSYASTSLATTTTPNFTGGTLTLDSSTQVLAQNFTINQAGGTLDQNGNVTTLSGVLSDAAAGTAGSLTVANTGSGGSIILAGISTYTGTTNVSSGATLALSGSGSISRSSGVADNGIFDIAGTTSGAAITTLSGSGAVTLGAKTLSLTAAADTFSGAIGGTGGIAVTGGTEILSGTSTYAGGTTISGGATVQAGSNANLGASTGTLTLDRGTLENTASFTMSRDIRLTGNGTFNTATDTILTNSSGVTSGTGGLVKNGAGSLVLGGAASHLGGTIVNAGTLVLAGANTYTGGTVLNGGVLKVGADNNLGADSSNLAFAGGMLQNMETFSMSRNIIVSSQGGSFKTDAAKTLTLTGPLSGSGRIAKEGAGTLILAGDSSGAPAHVPGTGWTGGLTINAGLVQVTNPYGLGWGNVVVNSGAINTTVDILTGQSIALAGGTSINTASATTTILSGTIVSTTSAASGGDACFQKNGTGTLNVIGSATLSSGTCVQEGLLLANGTIASDISVASGATLGGAGVIHGAVAVRGTLSAGNSPGLLTTTSTVTMFAGSTLQEDIAGTIQASAATPIGHYGYYSALRVTGNNRFVIQPGATLAPMLKNIFTPSEAGFASPSFTPSIGQTFRIVTAGGGIFGRFTTLAQPDGLANNTRFASFYNVFNSNSIDLKVLPSSYVQWLSGTNANTRSAARALDQILAVNQAGTGSIAQDQLLYMIAGKSEAELPGYAKALAGELHGAVAAALPLSGQWLQGSVGRHLGGDTTTDGNAADQATGVTPKRALWMAVGLSNSNWSSDGISSGFSSSRRQIILGVDVVSENSSRFGFGVTHANANVSANAGSGDVESTMGFGYGQQAFGDYVVDGLVGYGMSISATQRTDPSGLTGTLKSSQKSHNVLVSTGVRKLLDLGGVRMEPFARVMWQQTKRDAYSEGSAVAALSLTDYAATGTRYLAGLSGNSKTSNPLTGPDTYSFSLALGQDLGALVQPSLQASLAGVNTTIAAPAVGRTFVQANVSGTIRIAPLAYLYGGVTGETRSGKSDLIGNAGLRVSF
jgi:fibronectin-binding autotransporter adhesin